MGCKSIWTMWNVDGLQAGGGEGPVNSQGSGWGPVPGPGWSVQNPVWPTRHGPGEPPAGCNKREAGHRGWDAARWTFCKSIHKQHWCVLATVSLTVTYYLVTVSNSITFSRINLRHNIEKGDEHFNGATLQAKTHWLEQFSHEDRAHFMFVCSCSISRTQRSKPICYHILSWF